MSSDNFYSQSFSGQGQGGQLKARKATSRAAPPPPPRPSATAPSPAAASSYYGNATTTTKPTAPPPPRPATTTTTARQPKMPAASNTNRSSSSAPSFYGNTSGYASSSTAPTPAATSYYGTPAPAATFPSSTSTAPAATASTNNNAATASTNSDGWYSAPAPAAAPAQASTNDWYSASQQQQQNKFQQQQQPAYTDFTQQQKKLSSSEQLAGAMDGSAQQPFYSGNTFTPTPASMQSTTSFDTDFENEPPLLEELGINFQHIFIKTKAVVLPFSRFGVNAEAVMHEDDNDLAGPFAFAVLLGGELLLSGKFQFSYIYGFALFGCVCMTLVLNLMSPNVAVSIWAVASVLGYALLPVNVLALLKIVVVNLGKLERVGKLLAILTIAWCTVASTRLLEQKCGMRDQRYLVAYPIALLYSAFVMITIF